MDIIAQIPHVAPVASFDLLKPGANQPDKIAELLSALRNYYTSDRDKMARVRALSAFGPHLPSLANPCTDACVGRKIVSQAGYVGNPMGFLHDFAEKMQLGLPQGQQTHFQAYTIIGKHMRSMALKQYSAENAHDKGNEPGNSEDSGTAKEGIPNAGVAEKESQNVTGNGQAENVGAHQPTE